MTRATLLRLARARPGGFAARIGFNGLSQLVPIVVTLVLTPILLHRLGVDRFGIWSLALIVLSTLTSLDGGVSASLARFFAIHGAQDDRAEAGRLLFGSLLLFLCFGLLLSAVGYALAPTFVDLVHIPGHLHHEAVGVFRWLPLLVIAGLAADATAALLQGNGQFRELAISTSVSAGVFAVAVVVLVPVGRGLPELLGAMAIRYGVMGAVGLYLARAHLAIRRPLLPSWASGREVVRYSSRMQLASMTGFVNAELDGFVIAAVSPVRYVGLYSIGLQAASAARSVPLYAFSPLLTRLTTTFRREGRVGAAAEFEALERRWLPSVFGFGVVAVAAVGFGVTVWLGHRYVQSGIVAIVLLSGYIVHVALTGLRTCYVRAIGRPGLEARYSTVWTVLNAASTVPLALLGGMIGVVGATAATGIVASVYFVFLCRREERLPFLAPDRRWFALAILAAGLTVAGELVVLRSGVHGLPGFVVSGIPPLVALLVVVPIERRRARISNATLERVGST